MTSTEAKKLKQVIAQRQTEIIKITGMKSIADSALTDKNAHNNFKCRYQHLDDVWDNFEKAHSAILQLVSTQEQGDLNAQNAIFSEAIDSYYHIQAIYTQLFEDQKLNVTQNLNSPTQSHNNIKLPKIDIPKFGGDMKEWQTFIDLFESVVHDNTNISNIEKFSYLIGSLQGPPLALVKCTPLSSQNYLVAYNALKSRYDNKRMIATSHWHAIERTRKIITSDAQTLRMLLDTFKENVAALQNLGFPTKQWDFVLFNMLIDRLDISLITRFETECPKLEEEKYFETLIKFLEKQCDALDTVSFSQNSQKLNSARQRHATTSSASTSKSSAFFVNANSKMSCQLCSQEHLIYNCPSFLVKSPNDRFILARSKKWCTNCLGSRHSSPQCTSKSFCRICSKKHHTLLHFNVVTTQNSNSAVASSISTPLTPISAAPASQNISSSSSHDSTNSTSLLVRNMNTVLLSTALIDVRDSRGQFQTIRCLLDSCSQSNFITKSCVTRLGLPTFPLNVDIRGIAQQQSIASYGTSCSLKPVEKDNPIFTLDFVILPQICADMPTSNLSIDSLSHFSNLKLADPTFHISSGVDMLLGADIFGFLLKGGTISSSVNEPIAINTILGWIIMGRINRTPPIPAAVSSFLTTSFPTSDLILERAVKRFWELDTVPSTYTQSLDDVKAEKLYQDSFTRHDSGRYIVCLPFKDSEPTFEGSRDIALRRFFALERRLLKNPSLYSEYVDFMRDYLESSHMELISELSPTSCTYYIPHHCVTKPESSTTKLRVVFDSSAKDSNGTSLNDTLLVGPKLQQDIVSILLRFRFHSIVFSSDIKQMFRQISVNDKHCDYQRILWRFSKDDPVQDFRLKTVTYGVSSSPFLANRTISQVVKDHGSQYPLAAKILESDIYVDDIVSGCNSLSSALQIQSQLMSLLQKGGFHLRKWASNNPEFLSHLHPSLLLADPLSLDLENNSIIKLLGLHWNFTLDVFSYNVLSLDALCTKRNILSQLARIFDPLGFLAPFTFLLKFLVQHLWSLGLEWDSTPPEDVCEAWNRCQLQIKLLSNISVPRYIFVENISSCEIHGFCDASEKGYAGVIYFRLIDSQGNIFTRLLCAKSRIAPLKKLSLPRLELCGALLLSNLFNFVSSTISRFISRNKIFAWSDSTIVLSWIRSQPHRWNTFVSNRVTKIQEILPPSHWNHVSSENNPADSASRGLLPSELLENSLWWAGPSWLKLPSESWPRSFEQFETSEDARKITLLATDISFSIVHHLLERFSSFLKIQHVLCYILRFTHNSHSPSNKKIGPLSLLELNESLMLLIKGSQHSSFSHEISLLKSNKLLPKPLRRLSPFLDEMGILRVGGRLTRSTLAYEHKHPALLSGSDPFTQLLIEHTHKTFLHPGLQTTHFILSKKFWILSPRRTIRRVISKCHNCFRINPTPIQPPMGDLPPYRISQIKPFSKVGVDYGGPFTITMAKIRGAKTLKAYLCLFVCMSTKAIHLELASDLSTQAFLAALRRFIARRGRCSHIYSDQGTNFVGASRELSNLMRNAANEERIEWHFNPPSAPNFGGLWEAGIKSVKGHLSRVVGGQILTYEELYTVFVLIEAVLNSRPLCPISSDPNDLSVLTPGHFLTLEPLSVIPDVDLTDAKLARLNRWQLMQRMHQDFWVRWHREYLHTLMQRGKWTNPGTNITPGCVVLIKDELAPPLKWHFGRVLHCHPGRDGQTRVVTLKTNKGTLKRPVSKLCPLPA